jgi:hypothetical protein
MEMDGEVPQQDRAGDAPGSPTIGREFVVLHEGREKRAYCDAAGLWRNWVNGDVLRGDVRVVGKPPEHEG